MTSPGFPGRVSFLRARALQASASPALPVVLPRPAPPVLETSLALHGLKSVPAAWGFEPQAGGKGVGWRCLKATSFPQDLRRPAPWGIHRAMPVVCFVRAPSFALTLVSMGPRDSPCASVPVSVSEGYAVDGFVLTSDHVITSFQDPEGPPAESGTGLLTEREESPEVSEGLRGTAEPPCPQPL